MQEGPQSEKEYIKEEARRLFHENKNIPQSLIGDKLMEAQARLELALHYKNPYPRTFNFHSNFFSVY